MKEKIGRIVEVVVDRPLGSRHPKYNEMIYPVNYGYVTDIIGGDGEEQDVYLLGIDTPQERFRGKIIGAIRRTDDNEDKLVAAPEGMTFSAEEIRQATYFVEKYFDSTIYVPEEDA